VSITIGPFHHFLSFARWVVSIGYIMDILMKMIFLEN